MHLVNAATLLAVLCLAGCAGRSEPGRNDPLALWRMDNPDVRRLQEEETAKHYPDPAERKRLRDETGLRVELVYENKEHPHGGTGRAVAISPDGYYLTAAHVGDGPALFIVEHVAKKPLPPPGTSFAFDDYYSTRHHPGRVVWSDADLDLALLKFDRADDIPHFERMRLRPKENELVYSADEKGWGLTPAVGKDEVVAIKNLTDGMVGNGSFFSAGTVISSKRQERRANTAIHRLTLVARGGMSGAPLLTTDGALCGIIVGGAVRRPLFHRSQPAYWSCAAMIDPEFIRAKIEQDRAGAKPANAGDDRE